MKRVVNFLVAPLRLISRPVALLVVALLLIGAWGLTAFLQTAQVARDALASLTMSAGAVAASIDMPLEHFADTTDAFRATDLQGDKVALTSRLLRLQGALSPVGATFAVSASGQLLASSSPFSVSDASVADADWFRHAMGDNAMPVALQRANSWLRTGPSVILSRLVRDTSGKPAGLVGAVLRFEDFDRLIGRTWFGPGVSIELRGVDGVLALPRHDVPSSPPPAAAGSESGWSTSLMSTASRLLGIPAQLSASAPLRTRRCDRDSPHGYRYRAEKSLAQQACHRRARCVSASGLGDLHSAGGIAPLEQRAARRWCRQDLALTGRSIWTDAAASRRSMAIVPIGCARGSASHC